MKKKKIKKILIALDYNPTALKVAEEGYLLAKSLGAEVLLLHVITNSSNYTSSDNIPLMGYPVMGVWKLLEENDDLKKEIQQFLDNTKRHLGDETIKTQLKEGDLAKTVIDVAENFHAQIIVMGSHSRRFLEDIIMGSTTERVLHHTSIPVLIVSTKQKK